MKKRYITLALLAFLLSAPCGFSAVPEGDEDPEDEETVVYLPSSTHAMKKITKKEVFEITKRKIAEFGGVPLSTVTDEKQVCRDCGIDSLDVFELYDIMEVEFDICYVNEAFENCGTMTVKQFCKRTWKEIYILYQFPIISWW